ncbi:MAG: hypothetical protein COW16_10705 [Sphingomonadales bacterium CG12_big_fil_rev_8_21_14_0_65_65_10]|nr:MAG: hypothetical protein COW16_10705 [Sphingomonadales bacterium CG12_big_fil_rev_8_21_14_0_65_65_10]
MILVRGIKGNLKLNPAIKLWGGLGLLVVLMVWGVVSKVLSAQDEMQECASEGGVWIGAMPLRIGMLRVLDGRCEQIRQGEKKW